MNEKLVIALLTLANQQLIIAKYACGEGLLWHITSDNEVLFMQNAILWERGVYFGIQHVETDKGCFFPLLTSVS